MDKTNCTTQLSSKIDSLCQVERVLFAQMLKFRVKRCCTYNLMFWLYLSALVSLICALRLRISLAYILSVMIKLFGHY